METLRLDVWLDIACLFRTRSEAQKACKIGRVDVNGPVEPRMVHEDGLRGSEPEADPGGDRDAASDSTGPGVRTSSGHAGQARAAAASQAERRGPERRRLDETRPLETRDDPQTRHGGHTKRTKLTMNTKKHQLNSL